MKLRHQVPIVAGHTTGRAGTQEACAACGSKSSERTAYRIEGISMELCDSFAMCVRIYRNGRTALEHAAALNA